MVVPLRSQARLWLSLLHWAYYGLFPPLAAAFVRPCASLARCSVSSHRPRLTAARCSGVADALWACPRASSRFAAFDCALRVLATSALRAFDGQRPGRERIFTANASVCSAKNARNDVHAVISDLSPVLPILCQYSEGTVVTVPSFFALFSPQAWRHSRLAFSRKRAKLARLLYHILHWFFIDGRQ